MNPGIVYDTEKLLDLTSSARSVLFKLRLEHWLTDCSMHSCGLTCPHRALTITALRRTHNLPTVRRQALRHAVEGAATDGCEAVGQRALALIGGVDLIPSTRHIQRQFDRKLPSRWNAEGRRAPAAEDGNVARAGLCEYVGPAVVGDGDVCCRGERWQSDEGEECESCCSCQSLVLV
jgi:hypothetical protein